MSDGWRRGIHIGRDVLAVAAVAVSTLMPGCASSDARDEEAVRWAREVRVMRPEQVGDRGYEVLGQLEERVAIGATGEDDARSEAERRLKHRAAKLDADAVVVFGSERAGGPEDSLRPSEGFVMTPTLVCQALATRWLER
jgi:hypothetical protein